MSPETLTVLAYLVVWAVLAGYLFLVARKLTRLEGEIRALKSPPASPRPPSPAPSAPPAPAARP
jgi:CcmD family protein